MKLLRRLSTASVVLFCLMLPGCMSWRPPWEAGAPSRPSPPAPSGASIEAARELTAVAVDAEALQRAIDAYEAVLAREPDHTEALTAVADHSILMGTAYTKSRAEKRRLYRRAQAYAELAMYANPEFRALVDQGKRPWEAADALGPDEMDAMLKWMTALLYNFKECMRPPVRVVNIGWMKRIAPFLQRMDQIDPTWQDGVVPFNWGFYYFVVPRSLGGDKKKAAEEFARAVELGPHRTLYRWGRARFFDVKTKNREAFRKDLEWVLSQDPSTATDPPHWASYARRDAQELLDDIERYF